MTSDPRIDRLEGVVQELGNRLTSMENTMNSRFSDVNAHLNDVNARLTSLESRMTTMLIATIGITITGFVGLVVTILTQS